MKSLKITRFSKNDFQTLGVMQVLNSTGTPISVFNTLELPDLQNQSRISRIPAGFYTVKKRTSRKFGQHFHITNVQDRSYILIHAGNFHTQILGCVLIGKSFLDINKDGQLDVANSKKALQDLLSIMPENFKLEII